MPLPPALGPATPPAAPGVAPDLSGDPRAPDLRRVGKERGRGDGAKAAGDWQSGASEENSRAMQRTRFFHHHVSVGGKKAIILSITCRSSMVAMLAAATSSSRWSRQRVRKKRKEGVGGQGRGGRGGGGAESTLCMLAIAMWEGHGPLRKPGGLVVASGPLSAGHHQLTSTTGASAGSLRDASCWQVPVHESDA